MTTYINDYRRFGVDPNLNDDQDITAKLLARKGLALGMDKNNPGSSYKADYPPKKADNAGLNKDNLKDLRATHYILGNDPRSFNTIHKQDYVEQGAGINDPNDIKDRTKKMRMQNFKFGDDPLNYQTSAANDYAKRPRIIPKYFY